MRRIGIVAAGRVGTLVLTFVAGVALTRALPVEDRGGFALMLSVPAVAAFVMTAGLDGALAKSVGAGHPGVAARVAARRICTSVALAAGAAVAVLAWAPSSTLGMPPAGLAASICATPVAVALLLLSSLLIGREQASAWALMQTGSAAFFACWTLGGLAAGASALVFFSGWLISQLIGVILMARCLAPWTLHRSRAEEASIRTTARSTVVPLGAQLLMMRVQVPLLQLLAGTAAVAQLAVALPFVEALLLLPVAAASVLLPAYARGDHSVTATTRHAARVGGVSVGLAVALALLAPNAVPFVFGSEYRSAGLVVATVAPAVALFAGARVLQGRMTADGDYRSIMVSGLAGLGASVGCQIRLAESGSPYSAAIALAVGYTVAALVLGLGWFTVTRKASS